MAELDWASLLARATEEEGEEQLTEDLLARWLARNGSLAGAVYLSDGGRLVLEHRLGTEELPEVIQGELPSEFQFHHLPGGLLLYQGGSRSEQGAEAIDLALALAVRLASLKREVKRYDFEAGMREVEQQALYDVGLAITSTLDLEQLSEAILTWALALLDARRAALYLQDGNEYTLARSLGGEAVEVATTLDPHQDPSGLLPGASFLLLAPIEVEGNPRGLLVVGDKESRSGVGPFGEADQRTLALFANQAAISLENARLHREALDKQRLEREMELAAEIQRQILPKALPEVAGYQLAGWNRPARRVGGDYYDLLQRYNRRLLVALGDVSGKGVPAALLVSTLHSASRLMLDHEELGPEMLEKLNNHVRESSLPSKFITLFLAELDPASHRLYFLNAGHNQAVVLSSDGNARFLGATGVPLGLIPRATYRLETVELAPGDLLCLYSDGITECSGTSDEEYGLARLVETLSAHRHLPLAELMAKIDQEVTDFAEGEPQGDDQTVVLVRRVELD